MLSLSLYVYLLLFSQACVKPKSKIKHIARLLSYHRCCLSHKQSRERVENATANSVSSPTINVSPQFFAEGNYHMIVNGLGDTGD